MYGEKYLEDDEPYTREEREAVKMLMDGALEAEELFSLDELEEYARKEREK